MNKTKEFLGTRKKRHASLLALQGIGGFYGLLVLHLLAMSAGRTDRAAAVDVGPATASVSQAFEDHDLDGLDDRQEDRLAERFAPIVYHGERETSFPVSVDWWLERTHLGTIDTTSWLSRTRRVVTGPLRQDQLLGHVALMGGVPISSSGTRSRGKRVSYFLEDVSKAARRRTVRPGEWITYVHSYPNDAGGVTLQVLAGVCVERRAICGPGLRSRRRLGSYYSSIGLEWAPGANGVSRSHGNSGLG